MTIRPLVLAVTLIGLSSLPAAAGEVADLHGAWRGCLHRSFGIQAALTSRLLAADMALRACREAEGAYLTALSASPLVDGDDVARVRPALVMRAKDWLLGRRPSPTL
ncbi:hypothetical protein [Methylobacterium nigriterrae]|uniref:hypothetical protein n=1 Tax=Methylobacterium nigriterrae TaxID=3127512 RepID=UPI0030137844